MSTEQPGTPHVVDGAAKPRPGGQLTRRQRQVLTAIQRFSTLQGYMPSVRELGRELGGLAPATVQHHITMLRRKGYLEHDGSSHGLRLAARAGATPSTGWPSNSPSSPNGPSSKAGPAVPMGSTVGDPAPIPTRVTDDVQITGGGSGRDDGEGGAWGLEMPAMQVVIPLLGTIAAGKPLEAVEESDEYVPVPASLARGAAFALRVTGDSMIEDAILDGDLIVVQACDRVRDGEAAVVLLNDGTATLKRVHVEKDGVRLQPANSSMKPIVVDDCRIRGRVVGLIRQFD